MTRTLGTTAVAVLAALVVLVPQARPGTAWYVGPTGNDANTCTGPSVPCATINGAIGKAALGDTINVAAGTYTGSGDEVVLVDRAITLDGGWNSGFTQRTGLSMIDGQGLRRGVTIAPGVAASIVGLDVVNGAKPVAAAFGGGGILNEGTLTVDQTAVRNNGATGIYTTGPLTITNSTVSGNHSNYSNEGGGVSVNVNAAVTIAITNSTIANNTQAGNAGGIFLDIISPGTSVLQMSNDTISGNTASGGSGGGLWASTGWQVLLRDTILSGNHAPIGGTEDAIAAGGAIFSAGYNAGSGFTFGTGDIGGGGLDLQPLADNGGRTTTIALGAASAAVDAGDPSGCRDATGTSLTGDQRGGSRPVGAACDIGAYERSHPRTTTSRLLRRLRPAAAASRPATRPRRSNRASPSMQATRAALRSGLRGRRRFPVRRASIRTEAVSTRCSASTPARPSRR
jgi:hypothetical protein